MREIHFSGLEHSNPITQMGFLAKLANTVVKKKKKKTHTQMFIIVQKFSSATKINTSTVGCSMCKW